MSQSYEFWEKVINCDHEWSDSYSPIIGECYVCGPVYEYHCVKCGVFRTECRCHSNDGDSGWSSARWQKLEANSV